MPTPDDGTDDRAAIQALIARQAQGIRAKDPARALAPYRDGAVVYSLAPPLAQPGSAEEARAGIEAWFATWRGPIGYEVPPPEIRIGGDIAFAHGFVRISGTKTDGSVNDVWARLTLCLERAGNAWAIVHEHVSVPFYMDGSVRAAIDLEP